MRTIKISLFLFVLMTGSLMAQTITVTNRSEVATGKNAFYPVFNLKGDKLLFSSDSYIGLSMYDLSAKSVENISDEPGAGYEPIFDVSESKSSIARPLTITVSARTRSNVSTSQITKKRSCSVRSVI